MLPVSLPFLLVSVVGLGPGSPPAAQGDTLTASLLRAATVGDGGAALLALHAGAGPDTADAQGRTPLHHAARAGHAEVVVELLRAGASPEARDAAGRTPLHDGAAAGSLRVVLELLASGADPDGRDARGRRAGDEAGAGTDVAALLAAVGAEGGGARQDLSLEERLFWAAYAGRTPRVRELLGRGADPGWTDAEGVSALGAALSRGHAEIVDLLLDGTELRSVGPGGVSLASLALTRNRLDVLVRLLDRGGVRPDEAATDDPEGPTLLEWARSGGHADAAAVLGFIAEVAQGARPPVAALARVGAWNLVEMVLDAGASPDECHGCIAPALHHAAGSGSEERVRWLLERGADPFLKDRAGRTALGWALGAGHAGVADVLASVMAGAPLTSGEPLLVEGVRAGDGAVLEAFLRAQTPDPDALGRAMAAAAASDRPDLMVVLWEYGADLPAPTGLPPAARGLVALLDTADASGATGEGWTPSEPSDADRLGDAVGRLVRDAVAAGRIPVLDWALRQPGVTGPATSGDWSNRPVNELYRSGPLAELRVRPLHVAAMRDDTASVRRLLAAGADPFARDGEGRTPFRVAADSGAVGVLRLLAGPEARLGLRDEESLTPLERALASRVWAAADALLDAGARPDAAGEGWGAVHYAAREGAGPVLHRLLEEGAEPDPGPDDDWRPITLAAYNGHWYEALLLAANGASPRRGGPEGSAIEVARSRGHEGLAQALERTGGPSAELLLSYAVWAGSQRHVEALLARGVDPDGAPDAPALVAATLRGYEGIAHRLLDAGADIHAVTGDGWTALHGAVREGLSSVVLRLVVGGADVRSQTPDGWTPLHLAAINRRDVIAFLLLDRGADPAALDAEGKSPLSVARETAQDGLVRQMERPSLDAYLARAVWAGWEDEVGRVLDQGVDPDVPGPRGRGMLSLAAERGHAPLVKLLLDRGADAAGVFGADALGNAAFAGDTASMRLLLAAGAPIQGATPEGGDRLLPLLGAVRGGHATSVRLLLDAGADPYALPQDGILQQAASSGHWEAMRILAARAPVADTAFWEASAMTLRWVEEGAEHPEMALLSALALDPSLTGTQPPEDLLVAAALMALPLESDAEVLGYDPREVALAALARERGGAAWPRAVVAALALESAYRGWQEAYETLEPTLSEEERGAALLWAARHGHTELLARALARGHSPHLEVPAHLTTLPERTLLAAARAGQHGDAMLVALAFGADPRRTPLSVPVPEGSVLALVSPALPGLLSAPDRAGAVVALAGNERALLAYMDAEAAGVVPPLPGGAWRRAMAEALMRGRLGTVRALLARGVPESSPGLAGQLALWDAAGVGDPARVARLLAEGVDPEAPLLGSPGPLHVALAAGESKGWEEAALLLLEAGADPAGADSPTAPAVVRAARAGLERVALALLDRGVSGDVRDQDGRSALDHAAEWGALSLVRRLLDDEVAVRPLPQRGRGALEAAAGSGNTLVAQALRCAGAPGLHQAMVVAPGFVRPFLERPDCTEAGGAAALAAAEAAHRAALAASSSGTGERTGALLAARSSLAAIVGDSAEAVHRVDVDVAHAYADAGGVVGWTPQQVVLPFTWPQGSRDARAADLARARFYRAQGSQWAARAFLDAVPTDQAGGGEDAREGPRLAEALRIRLERMELLLEQGDPEEGRRAVAEAFDRLPEEFDVEVQLRGLAGAAAVELAEGNFKGASQLSRLALDSLDFVDIPDREAFRANLLQQEALGRLGMGQAEGARALLARVLWGGRRAWGAGSGRMAEGMARLGGLGRLAGDTTGFVLGARAREVADTLGVTHPRMARVRLRAALEGEGAGWSRFLTLYGAAGVLAVQATREVPLLPLAARKAYLDQDYPVVRDAVLHDATSGPDFKAWPEHIYEILAQWKGYLLESLRQDRATTGRVNARNRDDVELLGERLDQVRTALSRWVARRPTVDAAEWEAGLRALTGEKEDLEGRLVRALNLAGRDDDPLSFTPVEDIARVLEEDEAWVDVFHFGSTRGAEAYVAFVVTGKGEIRKVDLGPATAIDRAAGRWREAVLQGGAGSAPWEALRGLVWEPLRSAIAEAGGAERVWVAADGALVRTPWSLLPDDGRTRITMAGSARELLRLKRPAPEAEPSGSLFVVGDPDFGTAALGRGPFAPLPGTATEARAITDLARRVGMDVEALDGGEATVAAVMEAMPRHGIVHLATHGFFAAGEAAVGSLRSSVVGVPAAPSGSTRNPLVESGLALAGANLAQISGAGTLTAEELLGTELGRTRMVVLSACETGRGTEVSGQGVLGLQSSFLAAGARALLMSLWKVPDASTALLMEHFYRGLLVEGRAPDEALGRAQSAVRGDPRYAAPIHWAAWVLVGDVFDEGGATPAGRSP